MFRPKNVNNESTKQKTLEERVLDLEATQSLLLGLAEVEVQEVPAQPARRILVPAKKK